MKQEISTYEQQALDLLDKLGIKLEVTYLGYKKHFEDDKEERDCYRMTLTRGRRSASFDFGNSIANSGIKIVNKNNGKVMRQYRFDPKYIKNGKFDESGFKLKSGWQFASCDKIVLPKAPGAYDLLASITKYEVGSFEDFCGEFGYDTDSRRAEKTYEAVKEEYAKVCSIFTDEEMEQLQEIQ